MCEDGSGFTVDGKLVTFSSERDFEAVDWKSKGVELMMECTGKFLDVATLQPYFDQCGIKQVVVSAPVKEKGALNVVLGCNHEKLSNETRLVTNASCTTNCLAPGTCVRSCIFFFLFPSLHASSNHQNFNSNQLLFLSPILKNIQTLHVNSRPGNPRKVWYRPWMHHDDPRRDRYTDYRRHAKHQEIGPCKLFF
jgi:hypothetical protein